MKMTRIPASPKVCRSRSARTTGLVSLMCATFFLGGCFGFARKQPVRGWNAANALKPVYVPQIAAGDASKIVAPEMKWELPEISLEAVPFRATPARPKPAGPANTTAGAEAEKADPPEITIQLTPQESTQAQLEAKESMRIAEANLKATQGRRLNYAQTDLASKANGFLKDAREAATNGDWSTARTLAKKAQVISEELAASL